MSKNIKDEKIDVYQDQYDQNPENKVDWYQENYLILLQQNQNLQAQLINLQEQIDVITNSEFWHLTKPFRAIMDFLKRSMRKNKAAKKIWHGLKYWKHHGFRKTIARIIGRKKHDNECDLDQIFAEQRKTKLPLNIKFSILVPLYNTNKKYLEEMIRSVQAQTYPEWELCLVDGSDDKHSEVEHIVQSFLSDSRIHYQKLKKNKGISQNTNECAKMATGEYLAFLDHDDILSPAALFMNAMAIIETEADILYSDEDHLSSDGKHAFPFYKPDWSPDLLYSQMYICHFTVVRRELFEQIGGFNSSFDGSQDYDLMLRLTEHTDQIVHIPTILYTWRESESSTAANAEAKPYAHEAGRKALDAHLKRVYGADAYAVESEYPFVFDARFGTLNQTKALISIIIPMKDHWADSDACVKSILSKTIYQNYEILILDNRSEKPETFDWFDKIQMQDPRVRVIPADIDFNWSKLNNFGISKAHGDVFVFLNNDTVVISPDWLERLGENAIRSNVGVVGGLLMYEDGTIQHAGVVVGLNGLADHIFKGMNTVHFGSPFVSPMVSRNVLAVTGACMAISRATIMQIGMFDESFVICGSDVEICIRAYEFGLYNRYDAGVRLYHAESKSRDSYIPPVDFKRSVQCYRVYFECGDPFFNENLNLHSVIPEEKVVPMNLVRIKKIVKSFPPAVALCRALRRELMPSAECKIPEIEPIIAREDLSEEFRLNLLTPSVDNAHVFGGISTAIKFFEDLRKSINCQARIISTDAEIIPKNTVTSDEYRLVSADKTSSASLQLVSFNDRHGKTLPVRKNDIFVTTAWWTAYNIRNVMDWQHQVYQMKQNPMIYLIQDYEPGFYPWSSRYLLADSTYRMNFPIYAIFNSNLLRDFFIKNEYSFAKFWSFEPVLNEKLAAYLPLEKQEIDKKKEILVYGRPSIDRNAFALVVESLKLWVNMQPDAKDWLIFSAGEDHGAVDLGNGCYLQSLGKLSLEDYAKTMLESYAGISLMVSPHPSYPPLEMSTFGIKTITNQYANKNMSGFNSNLISVSDCVPDVIAKELYQICNAFDKRGRIERNAEYTQNKAVFEDIIQELSNMLKPL